MKNNLSAEQFATALHGMNACHDARKWAEGLDYNTAWKTCGNPDWMFFLIDRIEPLTSIVNELLICRFAREVVYLTDDPRVLACIEVREAWVRGEATDKERVTAIDAAESAAWAAAGVTAWAAARAAAGDAAWAAAGSAVEYSEWAAAWDTAWAAVGDTAWAAVGAAVRAKQCDIIRELVAQPELV